MVLTDFLVFGAILLFGLWALMRGFVSSFLWISGWVAAGFATIYGLPIVEPFARDLIPGETVAKAAAAITIFIVTLIVGARPLGVFRTMRAMMWSRRQELSP